MTKTNGERERERDERANFNERERERERESMCGLQYTAEPFDNYVKVFFNLCKTLLHNRLCKILKLINVVTLCFIMQIDEAYFI